MLEEDEMTLEEYRNNLAPYDQRIFDEMYDSFIETTIQLLLEADVSDNDIITVIENHWNISINELTDILHNEKIKAAVNSLTRYMLQNGYSDSEIQEFMKKHMVKTKLRHEHDLLMQRKNPEKIYKAVQQKNKNKEK